MKPAAAALALTAFSLAGCGIIKHNRPGPAPTGAHYLIGAPFQADGEWHYPHVFGTYDRTGLSTLIAPHHEAATTDGEAYDPHGLMAQSPVLPLPSIVRITNLDNGRSLIVRVNDRGPRQAGRIIALTPRVARLLATGADGVAEIRLTLLAGRTTALQASLGVGSHLTAAPVAAVTSHALPPPPGARGAAGSIASTPAQAATPRPTLANQPPKLSGTVHQEAPAPGPLYVEIGGFGAPADAAALRARLADMPGSIGPEPAEGRTLYAVRLGPYGTVAAADAALHAVLRRGVTDPEIVVR